MQQRQHSKEGAPKNYTHRAQTTGGAAGKSQGSGQSLPDDTIFVPPVSMFVLGGLGILVAIGANFWQVFTSFTAFFSMFIQGSPYNQMKPLDQMGAQPIITMICLLISISFQVAILFLVFRIERDWKNSKSKNQQGINAAKSTAIEIVQHVPLVLFWGLLGFIADTVGDFTFIGLYTNEPFILFMYGCALYASSTIMLARSIEYLWAGFVSLEKWKAFRESLRSQSNRKGP